MRALRDSLNLNLLLALFSLFCFQVSSCSATDSKAVRNTETRQDTARSAPYFPLAVGNRWSYSCSVEGEHAFDKTLSITGREVTQGIEYFRAKLQVGDDPKPLEMFYFLDSQGDVHSSVNQQTPGEDTLLVSSDPHPGDVIGRLVASSEQEVETPATGKIQALLIENFSLEDPLLSEEKRMDWEGKYYARGIGLIIEADGLGGECSLTDFSRKEL
jgi:hypothetical protein